MASVFDPGSGDLSATNKPAALWELVQLLAKAELAILPADTRPNNITVAVDIEGRVATVTCTLPIGFNVDSSSGKMMVSASNYVDSSFDSGGGDLNSTHLPGALLEAFQLVSEAEQAIPVETRPNNVSGSFDLEIGSANLTMSLPIFPIVGSGGNIEIAAVDYLPSSGSNTI